MRNTSRNTQWDDTELFDMRYDTEGTWIGIDHTTDPDAVREAGRWRDAALRLAQPWAAYVAERPDLVRRVLVAE
ncbi:MAG: DUF6879 family protein [Pseudonocardiaceae bacterium]